MRLGVISDTHGLLRPEAVERLEGADHILHAGDIGRRAILDALRELAPVTAIRGNVDTGADFADLPETETVTFAGHRVHVVHDVHDLALDPAAEGISLVVSGHSHKASVRSVGEVVYLNPGSAGPRRFRLPVTLAIVSLAAGGLEPTIEQLLP